MQSEARPLPTPDGLQTDEADFRLNAAEKAVSTWTAIATSLSPIVGHGGVEALHNRSLFLTSAKYPWLLAAQGTGQESGQFAALQFALSRQPGATAAAAHEDLLQTFVGLLTNLIGSALTNRLLASVLYVSSGARTMHEDRI